ncbi:hypothetical protein [Cellulomonas sp. Marseille-Q8402]
MDPGQLAAGFAAVLVLPAELDDAAGADEVVLGVEVVVDELEVDDDVELLPVDEVVVERESLR